MKIILILTLALSYSFNIFATEQTNIPTPYLGLASSVLIGFGTGPAIQNRELGRTLTYASSQGLGLVLLIAGAGSCRNDCSSNTKTLRTAGATLFLGSKLAEIIDSSLFSWKFYESEKMSSQVLFVPMNNGGSIATVLNF